MRWLSRLVSITVVLAVLAVAVLVLRSKMPTTSVGGGCTVYALFRDASRLAVGSPVKIAGVQVGEVTRLDVAGGFARVQIRLQDGLDLPAGAWITKRAESAFGDSYLEIIPTTDEEGAASGERLQCGGQLVHVQEGQSTDTVLRAIARAMPKIDRGLDAVHQFALDGRTWASGPLRDRIANVDRWLADGNLDRPIATTEEGMAGFEARTARAAEAVHGAVTSFPHGLDSFDDGVTKARARMQDLKSSLTDALARARGGMDKIDPTVQDMADVMTAINEGSGQDWKGTLGRLVNKNDVADEVEDVTGDVADATGSLNKFHSWLGARFEYDYYSGEARAYATAELRSHDDKFYLLEFEKGPLGSIPDDELSDVLGSSSLTRSVTISDGIRFTGQFGKTFGHLQLRAGIKESTPGAGMDVLLGGGQGRLRLSADVFGSFEKVPRLKVAAALELFGGIYVLAGVDDALSSPGYLPVKNGNTSVPTFFKELRYGRDYFLGATLQFTDADLATLIRVYGALIVGSLMK